MPLPFLILFTAVVGLTIGSFMNVLIERIPRDRSIGGRSLCMRCKKILRWMELIPVLSYLIQRGKCRGCKKPISAQYPMVELTVAILFVLCALFVPGAFALRLLIALGCAVLFAIAVIDAKIQAIPDILTITVILLSLAVPLLRILSHGPSTAAFMDQSEQLLLALLITVTLPAGLYIVSRGSWTGSGDVFLAGAIGLFLGTPASALIALLTAYVVGGFFAAGLLVIGRVRRESKLAFGPFLVIGAYVALFFGSSIEGLLLR